MVVAALIFYDYNIFKIGLSLIPFVFNLLVAGWTIGVLTTSLIMRFGQEAEVLAWSMVFLFQPISCVFYPLDVLPGWLQSVAWVNPAAHVFEGMRGLLANQTAPVTSLGLATGLNALYVVAVIAWFHHTFNICKDRGSLVRVGE
jgi:ABC-2 type transport system permease protein